jgi:hypothetical protein
MRLTADLIERSASFINAVKDRELDLRGKMRYAGDIFDLY